MDPFIGEIRIFGFSYPPLDWAYCNGQSLPVYQFQALYSLIATLYGSSGSPSPTQFNVPNLQSTLPMGAATMQDGSYTYLNQFSGTEQVQLSLAQLPNHSHQMGGEFTGQAASQTGTPAATTVPGLVTVNSKATSAFSSATPNTTFAPTVISAVGGSGPHENRQPFLAMNFCICTDGVYPSFP